MHELPQARTDYYCKSFIFTGANNRCTHSFLKFFSSLNTFLGISLILLPSMTLLRLQETLIFLRRTGERENKGRSLCCYLIQSYTSTKSVLRDISINPQKFTYVRSPSIYISTHPFVHPFIQLSLNLSICRLSVCLFVFLSVCLWRIRNV